MTLPSRTTIEPGKKEVASRENKKERGLVPRHMLQSFGETGFVSARKTCDSKNQSAMQ